MIIYDLYRSMRTYSLKEFNVDGDVRIKFLYRCLKRKYHFEFESEKSKLIKSLSLKRQFYLLILRHFCKNFINKIFLIFKSSSVEECKEILQQLIIEPGVLDHLSFHELAVLEYAALEKSCFIEALEIHFHILRLLSGQEDSYEYHRNASFELVSARNKPLSEDEKHALKKKFQDHNISDNSADYVTRSFHDSIYDKNILLVGPSFTSDEIVNLRNYSLVVFLNLRKIPDEFQKVLINLPEEFELKFISYWGNDMANGVELRSIDEQVLACCDYHVFKSNKNSLFNMLDQSIARRSMKAVDRFMVLGSGNLVQQCICDLVGFSPNIITITGMDFWTGKVIYDPQYKSSFDGESKRYMFAAHNVYSNFLFTKLLYSIGLVDCSSKVENVLGSDVEIYAEALEHKYNSFM